MVNPRARARETHTKIFRIDAKYRFIAMSGVTVKQHDELISTVESGLRIMTPATVRMMRAVFSASLVGFNDQTGYTFEEVNRQLIGEQLNRPGLLVPHDVRVLRTLTHWRWLTERRRSIPFRTMRGVDGATLTLGSRFEYVYAPTPDLAYALLKIDLDEAPRLLALFEQTAVAIKLRQKTAVNPAGLSELRLPDVLPSSADELAVLHADLVKQWDEGGWTDAQRDQIKEALRVVKVAYKKAKKPRRWLFGL